MPIRPNPLLQPGGETVSSGNIRPNPLLADEPTPVSDEAATTDDSSFPWGQAALATGAVALGGYAASKIPAFKPALEYGGRVLNSVRQQSMLSGLAPVKSFLGNIGAAVEQSALGRTLEPLKAFLSPETVRDAIQTFKDNPVPSGVNPTWVDKLYTPGRVMQSLDTATQNALQRGGLARDAAQTAVMQGPLPAKLQSALDSPVGRYLIPFRRTPFNQFIEGFGRFGEGFDPVVTPAYMATGAAHGYATADEKTPATLPLAIAGAATHGVPYAVGAIAGRLAGSGGNAVPDSQLASSILPVSEYGISQSVADPLGPYKNPALLKVIQQLQGR